MGGCRLLHSQFLHNHIDCKHEGMDVRKTSRTRPDNRKHGLLRLGQQLPRRLVQLQRPHDIHDIVLDQPFTRGVLDEGIPREDGRVGDDDVEVGYSLFLRRLDGVLGGVMDGGVVLEDEEGGSRGAGDGLEGFGGGAVERDDGLGCPVG
jgi:hypothetical protein